MSVYAVRPKLEVLLDAFASSVPTRQTNLTSSEKLAVQSPIDITPFVSKVKIEDNIERGTIEITLPNAYGKTFSNENAKNIRFFNILRVGAIIRIRENTRPIFTGTISQVDVGADPDGANEDIVISGGGIEGKFSDQTLFIDFTQRNSELGAVKPATVVASSPAEKMIAALTVFVENIKEFKQPDLIIQNLAAAALGLIQGRFGGKSPLTNYEIASGLTKDTYSKGMIHVISWINSINFGQKVSYWDFMMNFAQPPIYELFTHYGNQPLYVDATKSAASNQNLFGTLIYRKTPFKFLSTNTSNRAIVYTIPTDQVKSLNISDQMADVFTGVHVAPAIMDQVASILTIPVKYNPESFEEYGQRVLPIQLQGIQFPERDDKPTSSFIPVLKKIQDEIFAAFVAGGGRPIAGTIPIHYAYRTINGQPPICKGKILKFAGSPREWPRQFREFDGLFYITGVNTTFDIQNATVDQSLSVKWGMRAQTVSVVDDSFGVA